MQSLEEKEREIRIMTENVSRFVRLHSSNSSGAYMILKNCFNEMMSHMNITY